MKEYLICWWKHQQRRRGNKKRFIWHCTLTMKNHLIILFFLMGIHTYGQICDTINGIGINCIDRNGWRQGLWEEYVYSWSEDPKSIYGPQYGFCGVKPLIKSKIGVSSTGNYRNNKKIGTWKYFSESTDTFFINREITYHTNGSITERNFRNDFKVTFNVDSSLIRGYAYHKGDSIHILCSNKMGTFKLKNRILLNFDYPNFYAFKLELIRLLNDYYDSNIRQAKFSKKIRWYPHVVSDDFILPCFWSERPLLLVVFVPRTTNSQ